MLTWKNHLRTRFNHLNKFLGTIDLDKFKMKLAPIVYFVYNRPNHTKKSLIFKKK